MNRICRELQDRLALEGARGMRDDEAAQRHLEGCDGCFGVLERLGRLDDALAAMAAVDAPEATVERLMERVAKEPVSAETPEPTRGRLAAFALWSSSRRPMLWAMTSAASVALIALLLSQSQPRRADVASGELMEQLPPAGARVGDARDNHGRDQRQGRVVTAAPESIVENEAGKTIEPAQVKVIGYLNDADVSADPSGDRNSPPGQVTLASRSVALDELSKDKNEVARDAGENEKVDQAGAHQRAAEAEVKKRQEAHTKEDDRLSLRTARVDQNAGADGAEEGVGGGVVGGVVGGVPGGSWREAKVGGKSGQRPLRVGGNLREPKLLKRVEPVQPTQARVQGVVVLEVVVSETGRVASAKVTSGPPVLAEAAEQAVRQWVYAPTIIEGRAVPVVLTVSVAFKLGGTPASSNAPAGSVPAQELFAERARRDGLDFQEPSGYWRNTYVPGDPQLRVLEARLAAWDGASLAPAPHADAAPPSQPFDAPRNGALGVYVHADRAAVDGPQRMLVQVGLKAAARVGGARPAMNVGVVLDLRGQVSMDVGAAMRALSLAFTEARQAGDRFHLVVAGRPGGVVIAPETFKHGPVSVALDRLLAEGGAGSSLDLAAAVAAAYQAVCAGNDSEAPFGTSALVVVTGQALGVALPTLVDYAHQGAIAGVPLTTVGIGPAAVPSDLETLALAGQGRRHVLDARAAAAKLVDEELHAASNAVARAVRLRIRLAPGVRLVGVLGSHRLDEAQAQRVREAERSVDLRLARHMGIEADRGDDEDGLQVVIPAFQADDAHAIVLDVVVPGPGAVADVSVHYKDVAFLRNGVARTSLALPAGQRAAGPLEKNVFKNLLAHRLAAALETAGTRAASGDFDGARVVLESEKSLMASLPALWPGLGADGDLARDTAMLDAYARLLASSLVPAQRALVADSLRYAGRLKLLRRHV